MTQEEMFSPETYAKIRRPLAEADTLPPHVYTSPEWYRREVQEVFLKQWLVAAREDEIPRPGDYVCVSLAGQALLVVRDKTGEIHTMSASCRHRGTEVASDAGNCTRFVCPYHGWTYALTGELIGAPGMEDIENFDRQEWGLVPVRAERWGGFVFVNFDEGARGLLASMADLPERLAAYPLADMRITRKWSRRISANWKVWVENSREAYHTDVAHRESYRRLGRRPDGRRFHSKGRPGVWEINSGSLTTGIQVPDGATLPSIEDLSEEDQTHSHLIVFYPHLLLNLLPNHMAYHQLFPEGPEWTTVVSAFCFPASSMARPGFEREVRGFYAAADVFLPEDWLICERIQRGVQSGLARPGRYSLMEKPCWEFANYLLDRVVGR